MARSSLSFLSLLFFLLMHVFRLLDFTMETSYFYLPKYGHKMKYQELRCGTFTIVWNPFNLKFTCSVRQSMTTNAISWTAAKLIYLHVWLHWYICNVPIFVWEFQFVKTAIFVAISFFVGEHHFSLISTSLDVRAYLFISTAHPPPVCHNCRVPHVHIGVDY